MKIIKEYTSSKMPIALIDSQRTFLTNMQNGYYQLIFINNSYKSAVKIQNLNNVKDVILDCFKSDKAIKLVLNEKDEVIKINDEWELK